ncbi:glycosyltransferase [Shewanella sp. PP-Sp27a-2]
MKRILFVITGLGHGGAETQLLTMSAKLQSLGYDCLVVSMVNMDGILPRFRELNIDVMCLEMPRGKLDFKAILKFRGIVNDFKPTIVHSHMIHANIFCRIALIFSRIPLINTAHNVFEGNWVLEFIFRYTNFACDYVTQVSDEGYQRYISKKLISKRNSKVVKNAINSPKVTEVKNIRHLLNEKYGVRDEFLFLSVGRLSPQKNYQMLFEAILDIAGAHFLIVGGGPLESILKNQVIALGLEKKVHFLGLRDDIYSLMVSSDCFLMCSTYEGLPIAILEAISMKLPIVSTQVGAVKSIVSSENGYLVSPKEPSELRKAIVNVMNLDKRELKGMSDASYKRSHDYSIDIVIDEWVHIYANLSNEKV